MERTTESKVQETSYHLSKLNSLPKFETVKQSIRLSDEYGRSLELSGVYLNGVQYYDLKNILYINNTGLANLIDLLKSLLKQGIKVQFVNVTQKIQHKIKSVGLERVLNCS
jgi:MFS superfamily sulfate permease-like transporter